MAQFVRNDEERLAWFEMVEQRIADHDAFAPEETRHVGIGLLGLFAHIDA